MTRKRFVNCASSSPSCSLLDRHEMAYNQFQPSNQSRAHTLHPYPSAVSSTPTSPVSGYSMPGQSYDPRWYQRPPQQPSGFQYTNQQTQPRSSYPQQRVEPPPQSQSQSFRQIPHSPPVQSGFSLSSARPPSTVQNSYYSLLPAAANPGLPLGPPSSFHFSGSTATSRQAQSNVPPVFSTSPPNCSPRPLPTPKPRPESMPPPPRHTPQIQSPAPSRPAILTHSPFSPVEQSSTLSSPSSTTSSNGARRPLPTPQRYAKHTSLDLRARPSSPTRSSIAEQLLPSLSRLPSKPSTRNALDSDEQSDGNSSPTASTQISFRTVAGDNKISGLSSPTKFVPLWKRELEASTSLAGNSGPAMERRSTVSGPPAPRVDVIPGSHTSDSTRKLDRVQTSPSRRPLPLPQKAALSSSRNVTQTSPTRSMSTRAPVPSSMDEENHFNTHTENVDFADPEDDHRTPSPQYGIRDLPQRSRTVIANRERLDNVPQNGKPASNVVGQRARPVRSATLPPSSFSQNSRVPASNELPSILNERSDGAKSLAFRFAAMSLSEELSASPTRHPPNSRFPENVPPPPRVPTAQGESLTAKSI